MGAAIVGGPPAILLTRRARGGAAASPAEYQVALLSRPDGPVTVDIVLPPLAQRAVEVVGSSVLSFDASDWAKPQSVWLRAVPLRAGEEAAAAAAARCRTNDHGIAVACEPEQVVVQHALRDNRGGLVAAAEPAELAVEVYEPHAGIAVWPDALDLVEGFQGTVFVKLHQRPSATVVLDVVVEGVTALAIGPLAPLVVTAPARLRFGPGDWDMAQQVRVAGNTRRQRVPPPGALSRRDRRRHWLRGPCLRGW